MIVLQFPQEDRELYSDEKKAKSGVYEDDKYQEIINRIDYVQELLLTNNPKIIQVGISKGLYLTRLISGMLAAFICGILFCMIFLSLLKIIKLPLLFLFSIFFPAVGLALSNFFILKEGAKYDSRK